MTANCIDTTLTKRPARRLLLLYTASFPFGRSDPFLASELPFLEEAFDEIVIISNDTSSARALPVGSNVSCERIPYQLSPLEKLLAVRGIFEVPVFRELRSSRRRHREIPTGRQVAAILSTWAKARKFGRRTAQIAAARPGWTTFAYSYWANDMAVAAAYARASGMTHRAVARAHGWDVYSSRPEVGFLPFRAYLGDHLDALLFVSKDGRDFFDASVKGGRAIREVVRLGTPPLSKGPQGRGESFTIVSCSALIPLKRIELLARALVSCSFKVRWTHVGDGPCRTEIEGICSSAPANVSVDLVGQLAPEDVIQTWRRLKPSALINVSSSEGVPVSMMEAMSLGIPVIGTDVGGVREIVTPEVNGHLLSKDPTPQEIVGAIRKFVDMPSATHDTLAAGAWRTWSEEYRDETNFRKLAAMLDPSRPESWRRP